MKTRIEIPLCIVIPAKDEPPLHVFLQSEEDGRGRLTLAHGHRAWTASWDDLDMDFLTFLRKSTHEYLAARLLPPNAPQKEVDRVVGLLSLFLSNMRNLPGLDKASAYVEALDMRIKKLKRSTS